MPGCSLTNSKGTTLLKAILPSGSRTVHKNHPCDFQQQLLGNRAKPHLSDLDNSFQPGESNPHSQSHKYVHKANPRSPDEMAKLEHTRKVDTERGWFEEGGYDSLGAEAQVC